MVRSAKILDMDLATDNIARSLPMAFILTKSLELFVIWYHCLPHDHMSFVWKTANTSRANNTIGSFSRSCSNVAFFILTLQRLISLYWCRKDQGSSCHMGNIHDVALYYDPKCWIINVFTLYNCVTWGRSLGRRCLFGCSPTTHNCQS